MTRSSTSAMRSIILSLVMVLSVFASMPVASADPATGIIDTFGDGSTSVQVSTDTSGPATVNITLQRNTTIDDAFLHITYDSSDDSPGELTIDMDSDGQYEWHLGGNGDGLLGEQTEFSGGTTSTSVAAIGNLTWLPAGQWRLPRSASLSSSQITLGFTPDLGEQFSAIGAVTDLAVGDMNGDGHDDAVYLVPDHIGTNGTASPHIGWLTWSGSSVTTNWIETCADADSIRLGDANNDSRTDILVVAGDVDTLCQHLSGTSNWVHTVNVSMNAKFVDALLSDLDGDGQDDLISLDADGTLEARMFSAGAFATTAISTTVGSGSQVPMVENFANLAEGNFYGGGVSIVVAEEDMVTDYNTMWNFSSNSWVISTTDFECTGGPMQVFDWNSDGYDDLMGPTSSGSCLATWNGTDWNMGMFANAGLSNYSVGDHDRDGDIELFRADEGSPDGSDSTLTGSLEMHDFDGVGGLHSISTSFTPHTSPRALVFADLDGDGLDEQIVAAGEASAGLYIGAWHTVEWDLEGDGSNELTAEGYAGGTSPLSEPDQGLLIPAVSSELLNAQTTYDAYEVAWSNIAPVTRSMGAGTITQSALNMTYTATFTIEPNPTNSNLTNVLNNFMVLGSGGFDVPMNITSTRNGTVTLDSLEIAWHSGASSLQNPEPPVLSLWGYNDSQVSLFWTNTTSPSDLLTYQLFRAPAGTQFNTNQPLVELAGTGHQDTDGVTNADWDYAVRSVHEFGITSDLSNIITVQVPDTPPPIDTTPPEPPVIALDDVPGDTGGVLNLSFTPSTSTDVAYTLLFLETNEFTNASGIGPYANLSAGQQATYFLVNGLTDGHEYWTAAVAVDDDGNAWWNVTPVGPVHSTNDTTRNSSMSITVTGAGDYADGTYSGEHAKAGSPLSIVLQLTTEGAPLSSESIDLTMTTSEGETTTQLITGVTGTASVSWSDWLDYVMSEGAYGGVIQVAATWSGGTFGAASQAVAPANAGAIVIATVDATMNVESTSIQLDTDGHGTARVSLGTPLGLENAVLAGVQIDWQLGNGTTVVGDSGSLPLDAQGEATIPIDYSTGGWLDITAQPPWWLSVEPSTVRIDLYPPPFVTGCMDTAATNFDDTAEVDDGSCTYESALISVGLQCNTQAWTILDNNTQTQTNLATYSITCTIHNPNDVDVQLDIDFENSRTMPSFSHDLSSSMLWIGNLSSLNFTLSPNAWQDGSTLLNGTVTVTITMTAIDWTGTEDSFLLSYGFVEAGGTGGPDDGQSGPTNSNKNTEGGSSPMLLFAIVAVVLSLIGFAGLRVVMRDPDEDEEEDFLDEEWQKDEPERIRTQVDFDDMPTGRSLDELTTRGAAGTRVSMTRSKKVDRRAGSRPAPIREVIEESQGHEPEAEGEWDYTQDEDYHVDDEGVEWWKDEVGQWWYKYPEDEDWEAFEE